MNVKLITISAAMMALLMACGDQTVEAVPEPVPVPAPEPEPPRLETADQRLSYMVGMNIAKQFEGDNVGLDMDALSLGIADAQEQKESRLSQEQLQQTIATVQQRTRERQEKLRADLAEKNKAEGAAYLEANKAKDGVVVTDSGLQYRELTAGDGATPGAGDTVSVHYRGTLLNGEEFDSSYSRNQPATFPVTGVIAGWVEALQLMNVGDKWELVIPSDLAYGPGGTGNQIGPNATLIFEVELLEIISADAESAPDSQQN